jgi:exodeoxyribonuclease-3
LVREHAAVGRHPLRADGAETIPFLPPTVNSAFNLLYTFAVRIITLNVNGIRSAASKGFFDWLKRQRADVVCVQETKAQEPQLVGEHFRPKGYHSFYFDAERKGYSGTAIYSKREPDDVLRGFGVDEFDREGRYLEACFGRLSVVSVYLPSGSAGPERQASKFRCLDCFMPHLRKLARSRRDYVLCGDWNIAHKEIDLRNWRANRKNSGFLPEERAWLDEVFGPARFVDAFRTVDSRPEQYTWWSNRGQAWAKNVGWRIDYQVVSSGLAKAARRVSIYKARRFSDHAPLTVDYDL